MLNVEACDILPRYVQLRKVVVDGKAVAEVVGDDVSSLRSKRFIKLVDSLKSSSRGTSTLVCRNPEVSSGAGCGLELNNEEGEVQIRTDLCIIGDLMTMGPE